MLQQALISSALPGLASTDPLASNADGLRTTTFQGQNKHSNTYEFGQDYESRFPTGSADVELFTFTSNVTLPALSTYAGIFNDCPTSFQSSGSRENCPDATLSLDDARSRPSKRPRIRKEKAERVVFACLYDECTFTATSRKDLRRHLQSDKHLKDHVPGTPPWDRFYCPVNGCKFTDEGFSRQDNLRRHMKIMHDIILEREKPGRKRSAEE
ncbi:hypothetical protein F4803DRAFT_264337 [Xylaria telfairii]|nr:hypothetical protein F4803DRAFT_264337 [Xylaria telfairii]